MNKKEFKETKETKAIDALIKKLYKSEQYILTVILKTDGQRMQSTQLVRNCNAPIVATVGKNIMDSARTRACSILGESLEQLLKGLEDMTRPEVKKKTTKKIKK